MGDLLVTILGKRWRFKFDHRLSPEDDGDCDDPTTKRKAIRVRSGLKPLRELEITLHEILHAADWHKDEAWVAEVADDLAKILWRLGYRRKGLEDDST